MIHHTAKKLNKGTDALSRRYLLLSTLESKVVSFKHIQGLYENDEDFKEILEKCSKNAHGLFHVENGFLFKETRMDLGNF